MFWSNAQWLMAVTPGLKKLKQEDHREFKASLVYTLKPCF